MKNRVVGWALVLLSTTACGGGAKPSNVAASTPAGAPGKSHVKVTLPIGDPPTQTDEFDGPAFGFFSPQMGSFNIVVADAATDPAPTCDTFVHPKITKGGFIDMWLAGKAAVGKVDVAGAAVMRIDDANKKVKMGNALTEKVVADFKTLDAKSFTVEISSAADARGPASGTISGTMCPDAVMGADSGDASSAPSATGPDLMTAIDMKVDQMPVSVGTNKTLVMRDPKTNVLVIAAWSVDLETPSCDQIATVGPKMKKGEHGAVTLVYAKDVKQRGPGKYPLYAVKDVFVQKPGDPMAGPLDATIDVKQFDEKGFKADVGSTSGEVKGNVEALVCPEGHVDAPKPKAAGKGGKATP